MSDDAELGPDFDRAGLAPAADSNRRGPGEWIVIALLVLLIGFVAWKQFGSLLSDEETELESGGPQHLQMGSGGEAAPAPHTDNTDTDTDDRE